MNRQVRRLVHSLAAAVANGTVSDVAARCGLSQEDLRVLADHHGSADVLVRLRSHVADGRIVCRIRDFLAWTESDAERIVDGRA